MGFHTCKFCETNPRHSSGDVSLAFDDGRVWQMPDMILHYIADHGYIPPQDFQHAVRFDTLVTGARAQTKTIRKTAMLVGYLIESEPLPSEGSLQHGFFMRLWSLMQIAASQRTGEQGTTHRMQTRGKAF